MDMAASNTLFTFSNYSMASILYLFLLSFYSKKKKKSKEREKEMSQILPHNSHLQTNELIKKTTTTKCEAMCNAIVCLVISLILRWTFLYFSFAGIYSFSRVFLLVCIVGIHNGNIAIWHDECNRKKTIVFVVNFPSASCFFCFTRLSTLAIIRFLHLNYLKMFRKQQRMKKKRNV